jgi:hypothetical protein
VVPRPASIDGSCRVVTVVVLFIQVKLLNSISEGFDTAMASTRSRDRATREEFLRQFEAINKGVGG